MAAAVLLNFLGVCMRFYICCINFPQIGQNGTEIQNKIFNITFGISTTYCWKEPGTVRMQQTQQQQKQ